MKKVILILFYLSTTLVNNSCTKCNEPVVNNCNNSVGVLTFVEQMPEFPGGSTNALYSFIASNLIYPEKSKKDKIEGTSVVTFIVNMYGHIDCIKIKRSLNVECDNEALRIMNIMPNWIPGKRNNQPVSVSFILPIHFKL